jgi:phosphopantothenoylcysteine decarboxylase/phosphopantothenate--cysteine ligase
MRDPIIDSRITLGVTGSIACYKAVDLASRLVQAGAELDVIMTDGALEFLKPITFSAITHKPVVTSLFDPQSELSMDHVALAGRSDVILVAPATADAMAKAAWGLAGDALSATLLATRAPVIFAPAMDANMYDNAATVENVARLRSRGAVIAGPAEGRLASGLVGSGRMLEPSALVDHARMVLARGGDLAGRKVVVSAGGTQEAIDPVRVVTNRSSGKMGFAIARAARDRGASAVIVAAPTALPDPTGVDVVRVESALEMRDAVTAQCEDADAVVMAAAVADWRPATSADRKLKKGAASTLTVDMVRNPDIVAGIGGNLIKVGFAAETEDVIENAHGKLVDKGLDLIAANDVTSADSGFASDTNRVALLDRDGGVTELGLLTKYDVGHRILDKVVHMLESAAGGDSR